MLDLTTKYAEVRKKIKNYLPAGVEAKKTTTPKSPASKIPDYVKKGTADGKGEYYINVDKTKDPYFDPIKAERSSAEFDYDPSYNIAKRSGLPSRLFQVDHTIPLWAQGTDSESNKRLLSTPDHDKKTKVGAVARALYANKKIGMGAARVIALTWEGKDVSGINIVDGKIPIEVAERKVLEWQQVPKVTLKDWWGEMKKGPKGPLGEFAQGAASEATLGYIPAEGHKYKTKDEQAKADIARYAGKAVGTLASFVLVAGLISKATKGIGAASKVVRGTGKTAKAARGTSASKKASTEVPNLFKAWKTEEPLAQLGKVALKRNTAYRALNNAGLFTIHGQLSKQEENTLAERTKRFLSDAAFGGILAVPGQTLRGYSGLGMGVYALSLAEGASPADALLNTTVMVGMHGLGKIGYKKNLEAAASEASMKYRERYGIKPKKDGKYSLNEIINDNAKAIGEIEKKFGPLETSAESREEVSKIIVFGRQLYKGGLSKEAKNVENIKDVRSIFKRYLNAEKSELDGIPGEAKLFSRGSASDEYADDMAEILLRRKQPIAPGETFPKHAVETKFPTGVGYTTGVSGEIAPSTKISIKDYVAAGGKKGDHVFGILRDDKPFVDFIKKQKKYMGLFGQKYKNPENNIQWFADKGGEIYKLGSWPTQRRIINPRTGINKRMTEFDLPTMEPKFNNDAIATALRENNSKAITGTIKYITPESKIRVEPWVSIEIKPEDWVRNNGNVKLFTKESLAKVKGAIIKGEPKATLSGTASMEIKDPSLNAVIKDFENALGKKDFNATKELLTKYGRRANENMVESITESAEDLTVGGVVNFLKSASKKNMLNSQGQAAYNTIFSNGTYYERLSQAEKELLSRLKLFGKGSKQMKLGEVEQVIELPKLDAKTKAEKQVKKVRDALDLFPKDEPLPQKVSKAAEKVTEGLKRAPEIKAETIKNESVKELTGKDAVKKVAEIQKTLRSVPEKTKTKKAIKERVKVPERYTQLAKGVQNNPKVKRSNQLYKEAYEKMKDGIDEIKATKERTGYINSIKSEMENLHIEQGKGRGSSRLTVEEINKIEKQVKEDMQPYAEELVTSKYSPVEELNFGDTRERLSDKLINEIGDGFKAFSSEKKEKMLLERLIKETRDKLGTGKEFTKDKNIETAGKISASLKDRRTRELFKRTANVYSKQLKDGIDKGKVSKSETSKAFNSVLDEGLKETFGKSFRGDYSKNYTLNYLLSPTSAKGKEFSRRMFREVNPQGWGESQSKDVILKRYKYYVQEGKDRLTDAEFKDIYSKSKQAADAEIKSKTFDKAPSKETVEAIAEGLAIKGERREGAIGNLTPLDEIFMGMLAAEADASIKYTKKEAASDAKSFLKSLIKMHNEFYPNKTVQIDNARLNEIVNKVNK